MPAIRLGTRGSELARRQANEAADALRAEGLEAELVIITTTGDRDQQSSLLKIGGQGVFVHELENALIESRIDIAVHSAKDVPTDLAPGTTLCAFLPRADVRDALISRNGERLADLAEGALHRAFDGFFGLDLEDQVNPALEVQSQLDGLVQGQGVPERSGHHKDNEPNLPDERRFHGPGLTLRIGLKNDGRDKS